MHSSTQGSGTTILGVVVALLVAVFGAGCGRAPVAVPESVPEPVTTVDPAIEKVLAELPPEKRALAETQRKCPISGRPLGSMGPPLELSLTGETVFVCCEQCSVEALTQEKKTLATTKALQELSKLPPEKRKLAEAQGTCPVGQSLGSMGVPVELTIASETVFPCCEHCRKSALKDPDKTLAKVKAFKALAGLSPEDRKLAEAQGSCPVSGKALGSMGLPVKLEAAGEIAFLCCEACRKSAAKDVEKTVTKVKELREKPKE